jgi:peptidoglycan hydrolase CwlO-like protein
MNKRFIVVGVALCIIISIAFFVGSPMFGGFDMGR